MEEYKISVSETGPLKIARVKKCLLKGIQSLSDSELIALLIGSGTRKVFRR